MTDEPTRKELRSEGRSLIQIAAVMFAIGATFGTSAAIFPLAPILPSEPGLLSYSVGLGTGLLGAMTLMVTYRLLEGRLVDAYLESAFAASEGDAQ